MPTETWGECGDNGSGRGGMFCLLHSDTTSWCYAVIYVYGESDGLSVNHNQDQVGSVSHGVLWRKHHFRDQYCCIQLMYSLSYSYGKSTRYLSLHPITTLLFHSLYKCRGCFYCRCLWYSKTPSLMKELWQPLAASTSMTCMYMASGAVCVNHDVNFNTLMPD